MDLLGAFFITIGIFYLTYSVMSRTKPTIYFKNLKIIKGKEDEYLKLQLKFSILNSLLLILIGGVASIYNLNSPYVLLTPLIFHLVNFIMVKISRNKGYVYPKSV